MTVAGTIVVVANAGAGLKVTSQEVFFPCVEVMRKMDSRVSTVSRGEEVGDKGLQWWCAVQACWQIKLYERLRE